MTTWISTPSIPLSHMQQSLKTHPDPLLTSHLLLTQLSPGQVRDVISGMPVLGLHWCLRFVLGISD